MSSKATDKAFEQPSPDELKSTISGVKKMLLVGGILAAVGYLLLLFALSQEFSTLSSTFDEDSMKMWLKLGGVGHILLGIFISLVAIVRVLSIMPDRLGYLID